MANGKEQPVQFRDQKEDEEGTLALGLGQGEKQQHEEDEELKPWEQHSAVISIPRYDYRAPSSLLERSHSGFLVTCPIKREKSATKEAISILEKFASSICSDGCARPEFSSSNKKRKVSSEETIAENIGNAEKKGDQASPEISGKAVGVVSLETEKNLQLVVSKLVHEYLGEEEENLKRPIKFAVGYNRRGIEETEMKKSKSTADSKVLPLLDRDSCFKIVAGAFKEVAKNSTVDLKSPEVAVLVELLPISGVPHELAVVGVSILPHGLITTKPRLCIKPLVSDAKPTKRRD